VGARWRVFGRGAIGRCPNCGGRGLFESFFRLRARCPTCGLTFEREEGYWLGAMIVNIGVTEALFGVFFVGGMLATWPDVPWTGLLVGGVAINVTVPVVYYPLSKTTWMGIHLAFVPPDAAEEAAAYTARAADADARRSSDPLRPAADAPDDGAHPPS
jgi:uncharacterized protein (DUF983 family)